MCDLSANAYQLLSRPLSNIELLCQLSPMADSDQAQIDILVQTHRHDQRLQRIVAPYPQ